MIDPSRQRVGPRVYDPATDDWIIGRQQVIDALVERAANTFTLSERQTQGCLSVRRSAPVKRFLRGARSNSYALDWLVRMLWRSDVHA